MSELVYHSLEWLGSGLGHAETPSPKKEGLVSLTLTICPGVAALTKDKSQWDLSSPNSATDSFVMEENGDRLRPDYVYDTHVYTHTHTTVWALILWFCRALAHGNGTS